MDEIFGGITLTSNLSYIYIHKICDFTIYTLLIYIILICHHLFMIFVLSVRYIKVLGKVIILLVKKSYSLDNFIFASFESFEYPLIQFSVYV